MKSLAILSCLLAAGGVTAVVVEYQPKSSPPIAVAAPVVVAAQPVVEPEPVAESKPPVVRPAYAMIQGGANKIATITPPSPYATYSMTLVEVSPAFWRGTVPNGAHSPGGTPELCFYRQKHRYERDSMGNVVSVYHWRAFFTVQGSLADWGGGWCLEVTPSPLRAVSVNEPGMAFTQGWSMVVTDAP